jgi:hypothetical protein
MEQNIDRDISQAETRALKNQNAVLLRQNELLRQELNQLKDRHGQSQKELAVYKKIVFDNSSDHEVLEMQHQRIFELETQLDVMQGKYSKVMKSGGSNEVTELTMRCKEYERRLKERENDYNKQISVMREKIMKQNAVDFVETKRLITSPHGELKKSSLAVGKFV